MEKLPNEKRLREEDGIGGPSPKKLKFELDDESNEGSSRDDESNEGSSGDNESNEGSSGDGEFNEGSSSDGESNEDNDGNEQQNDVRSREEEEHHFLRLFTLVLNTIIYIKKLKDVDIYKSIQLIKASFHTGGGPIFHTIDFTQWKNICGYLYRWASHGAGFARNRILNAMRNCEAVKNVFQKPDLRVICLGSGPGNDAVGLCSALSELQYLKTLKITLVDKFKEWSLCIKLLKIFVKEGSFGKNSELFERTNVKLSYIQTDLPGDITSDKKYFEILAKADVIVMSKLVSILDRSNWNESEKNIIESLYKHTKEDAVILLNDVCFENRWRERNFHLVYSWGNEMQDEYRSTRMAKKRFDSYDSVSSKLPINILIKK